MAEHFLTKTRIDLGRCIQVDGSAAVEQYKAFSQQLAAKAGSDVAKLFAEPLLSKGNDQAASTVSWYSDRAGQGLPVSKLDAAAQQQVGEVLSARLESLKELLHDPDLGELISAALYINGPSDIWSVEGQPVLVNWGILPEGGSDASTRAAHYARTLGPYLAMQSPPPLNASELDQHKKDAMADGKKAEPASAMATPNAQSKTFGGEVSSPPIVASSTTSGSGSGGDGGNPIPPVQEKAPHRRVPMVAWVPMVVLLFLFGAALTWLLIPGNRIFSDDGPQPVVADQDTLLAAREINRALESRLEDLNAALEGAVCRADGTLLMPSGLTIEGLLPPDLDRGKLLAGEVIKANKMPVLPPAPERVVLPREDGQVTDTASLLQHIDERTAMVLVGTAQGMAAGTGFFVGPDLLVTNFHVIEGATTESIFVTNKALGSLKQAELIKTLGPMREVGADFALLRIAEANQAFYTLRQSDASMRLQSVIAAGYPGDVLRTDSQFKALKDGDVSAVPELTVTDGSVNTEQSLSASTNAVVHSAPISKGNSGGPLIDMCGRVVGVNTFVVQGPLRNLNFALATDDLVAFLAGTPAEPVISGEVCEPLVARPTPVPIASGQ